MLNETLHPEAEELTALLFELGGQVEEEERAYYVLENFMDHRSDECKADLYSRIAEQQLTKAGRVRSVSMVSRALWQNQQHFPRG